MNTRKGWVAESLISRRRQQTVSVRTGGMQDAYGVWRRARQHSLMRNRRDPSRRSTSDEGGSYKPMVKWNRAGRESEGFIVLLTPVERPEEGRDPALIVPRSEGKRRGMVVRPNHPLETCENSSLGCTLWPSVLSTFVSMLPARRSDDSSDAWTRLTLQHACYVRRSSVSRMREIRTSGLKGDLRKRSQCATAPEVYQ